MELLRSLAAEFPITLSDGTVWLSIGEGLLFGAVCLLFGAWVARLVGLLEPDAPAGEILGVGLASGLLVLVSWWAAVASGGRSSFTPVAAGFAVSIVLAVVGRPRSGADPRPSPASDAPDAGELPTARSGGHRDLILVALGGAAFVVVVALLLGSTMTLRPRAGVQPLEFNDEAYYSVLGADLAQTGTESLYSPSGFTEIAGLPPQTWYHWGEAWLAAAAITIFGVSSLDARHLIVLPLLLLAAAVLTGTIVRRVTGSRSRGAFLFGFLACLFLAPLPFGADFRAWAIGLIFGITLYGLVAVAVLLGMYALAVLGRRPPSWALAAFVASAAAAILPAHIVVALLAVVGVGSVSALRIGRSLLAASGLPVLPDVWRRTSVAAVLALLATAGWGLFTGHGIGTSGLAPDVSPFNSTWSESVAITTALSGVLLLIPVAWFLARKDGSIETDLYAGTAALLVAGAIIWGALFGDFTSFHLFFAGIAAFATPVAAVAARSVWVRLRATGHLRLATAVFVLCALQLGSGVTLGVLRLWRFGPGNYPPVPVATLAAIRSLPTGAKLAYACLPFEEVAFWDAELVGIDAHAGRRIVPMCFQADTFGLINGTPLSPDRPSPLFRSAPQRALYPDAAGKASTASVVAFLKANGIGYIYADTLHPNTLVPDAIPIATNGDTQVLRIP